MCSRSSGLGIHPLPGLESTHEHLFYEVEETARTHARRWPTGGVPATGGGAGESAERLAAERPPGQLAEGGAGPGSVQGHLLAGREVALAVGRGAVRAGEADGPQSGHQVAGPPPFVALAGRFFSGPANVTGAGGGGPGGVCVAAVGDAIGKTAKPLEPTITRDPAPRRTTRPHRDRPMRADSTDRRTVATPDGVVRLNRTVRRCRNDARAALRRPYRPEAGGRVALPRREFGLDVVAPVGRLRSREHRPIPEIRARLVGRGVAVAERTVLDPLDRYDESLAAALTDDARLRRALADQARVILAIDGLRPDVGHEVPRVVRDCPSGEILPAKSLLSARREDPVTLLTRVKGACPVPVAGVVSDGRHGIRRAVAAVCPDVPYHPCPFHDPRESPHSRGGSARRGGAREEGPRGARDRADGGRSHRPRGRRGSRVPLGRPQCPDRRRATAAGRVGTGGARPAPCHRRRPGAGGGNRGPPTERRRSKGRTGKGSAAAASPPIRVAFGWGHRAAHVLGREDRTGADVRRRLSGMLGAMTRHRELAGDLAGAADHFGKASRSY